MVWRNLVNNPKELLVSHFNEPHRQEPQNQDTKIDSFKTTVKCLALDYDGTLSPIDAPRMDSWISEKKLSVLEEIGKTIPIIVITTKDLTFIMPRTPFAIAWSAVGGLETRIGNKTQTSNLLRNQSTKVTEAIAYAKSRLIDSGVEIEEKFDANRCLIAFCVDWRHAGKTKATLSGINEVAAYCETLGLELVWPSQHFFEVYPQLPDKGRALLEILKELGIEDGVMYIGDSEMDNTAFNVSNVSLGVIHRENDPNTLACDYLVKFEDVTSFLASMLTNQFLFDSEYFIIQNKDKYMEATLRNNEKRSCCDA